LFNFDFTDLSLSENILKIRRTINKARTANKGRATLNMLIW